MNVRQLDPQDLPATDRVFRLAFGTAAGLTNPLEMFGDAGYMHRWHLETGTAFVAEANGEIVGSNFLTRWGSLGTFGPLTVHPDYWNQGIASALMEATMAQFVAWKTPTVAFFTSSHSPKHLWFYSKFGFYPGYLTTVLVKEVESLPNGGNLTRYSELACNQRQDALSQARALTNAIYQGLDLQAEIKLVQDQGLGDTLLLWDQVGLAGFAILHIGPGSEGGSHNGYIKFAAARPGPGIETRFEQLLTGGEIFAASRQLKTLTAGVNTSRQNAYQRLLARGYKIRLIGVAMHHPPEWDYCRPDVYVLDDRR
jgi:predicted N-acetyltransferase YhbS